MDETLKALRDFHVREIEQAVKDGVFIKGSVAVDEERRVVKTTVFVKPPAPAERVEMRFRLKEDGEVERTLGW